MRRFCQATAGAIFAFVLLLGCLPARAQEAAKRLILKDGSYQPAVKWEIKGDRVRYLSAERFEWEELPNDLVDWPATEKWEKERGSTSQATKEVDAEAEAERKEEEARSPTVAPGLRLPSNGGVFLLDDFHGQKQLAEVEQNGSEINKQMGHNILRAVINPLAGAKQSIEVKGTRAHVQAHETQPILYANIESAPDAGDYGRVSTGPVPETSQRFRLVRLEVKKDSRVVGNLKIAVTGKVSQQQAFVETSITAMPGSWLKIMPAQPLPAGEYALVEVLSPKEVNLYVWDFGVDPNAPPNPTAWKPQGTANSPAGPAPPPQLQTKRP